jgi:glutathione synthase/RimK-type ligase-like ATP-grasp enzyme
MYLIASKSGILTGRLLANKLGINFHTNLSHIRKNIDILVRYGNAGDSDNIKQDTDINSRESIIKISNKKGLFDYLKCYDIITPKYHLYNYGEPIPEQLEFPLLSRRLFHHGGLDIKVCDSSKDIPYDTEALVPFYQTTREYRVHVLFGEVIKVLRKVPINENTAHPIIRSSYRGWHYKVADLNKITYADSLIKISTGVAKILGCAFCGIDIAWSKELKRWIVWEVNSAPSLNSQSLDIYSDRIIEHFKNIYGSKHDIRKSA